MLFRSKRERTIVGKKGEGTRLWKMSSKFVSLKKRCALISSASASLEPSRRTGSRVRSCRPRQPRHESNTNATRTFCKMLTLSLGMWIGYRGSSSRIASKISSSSSPRNGDCPSNIS